MPSFEKFKRDFTFGDSVERNYLDIIKGEHAMLSGLQNAKSYDEARAAIIGHVFPDLPTIKKGKTAMMEDYQLRRTPFKADVKEMQEHFIYTSEEWAELYSSLYRLLSVLYRFECKFDELFTDGMYFDLSRHAIECAEKMKEIFKRKGYSFFLETPTNQQFILLENKKMEELSQKVRFCFWEKTDGNHTAVRFATSWSTTEEDLSELEKAL
jgi:hypothetical protein